MLAQPPHTQIHPTHHTHTDKLATDTTTDTSIDTPADTSIDTTTISFQFQTDCQKSVSSSRLTTKSQFPVPD